MNGLENNPTVEDIMDKLKENEVSVKNVYLMKGTRSPLYIVVKGSDITMKNLQKKYNIQLILK